MPLEFVPSPDPTLGVEIELEIVDRTSRALVSKAAPLIAALPGASDDGTHAKAKPELLECCVEVITGICADVDEVCADLRATIAEVQTVADRHDVSLLSSGTHPFSTWNERTVTPDPRYQNLVEELGWVARRMQIFGMHVHVGIASGVQAIAVSNGLTNYVPHLLALTSSSPYWSGFDTGLASARSKVFEGLPTAGLPENIDSWTEFSDFIDTLIAAGSIKSVREVWWDVRPHPAFGTVELRMCDGVSNMTEIGAVTALAQCLTVAIDRATSGAGEAVRGLVSVRMADWIIRQNKWRAARHGLDAELIVDGSGRCIPVRTLLQSLAESLEPLASELGCAAHLEAAASMIDRPTSAERQRAVIEQGGTMTDVVDHLVAELRRGNPTI